MCLLTHLLTHGFKQTKLLAAVGSGFCILEPKDRGYNPGFQTDSQQCSADYSGSCCVQHLHVSVLSSTKVLKVPPKNLLIQFAFFVFVFLHEASTFWLGKTQHTQSSADTSYVHFYYVTIMLRFPIFSFPFAYLWECCPLKLVIHACTLLRWSCFVPYFATNWATKMNNNGLVFSSKKW